MVKEQFNKRNPLWFKHFNRKGYSLFAALGKEVLISVLSVSTLTYAKADGVSVRHSMPEDKLTSQAVKLSEVVVTGSRAPLTVSQQSRMVTVLSREDIEAAPVQSVNDLLKLAIGVDVRQKGPLGAGTDVGIRGGTSEQVAILLNGINICDAQTAHNVFDIPVDLSEIERIEVLEGPAGKVYGTSSLLGAINIVTKAAARTSLTARMESGSYGYLSTGLRGNVARDNWNNQLSFSATRSDGYSRSGAGNLNADYRTLKSFYQGTYQDAWVDVKWHAGMSLRDFGANTFYGVKWDNQFEHTFKTFTAIQAENKQGKFHLRPSVYWNRGMDRFELFRGEPNKYPFNYHRADVYGVNLNAYFDWVGGRTAFGAELRHEDLISTVLGNKLDNPELVHGTNRMYTNGLQRTNTQFVLEHNVLLDRFTLSAGLIAVKNSQANMNMRVYPGVDMSYRVGDAFKLYASYNTSLRMPSMTELFYSVGGHKPNPHLQPEELSAIEAGVKLHNAYVSAQAAVYYNHYKNQIDWIQDGTRDEKNELVWKSVNFGVINSLGAESSFDFNFLRILPSQRFLKRVSLGYSFINQDHKEEKGIVSRYVLEYLKHKFVADAQMHLTGKLDLGLSCRYLDRMGSYTDRVGAAHSYKPYSVVDARLSWNESNWKAYLNANNVLNKTYMDAGNVPQPGLWVMAGVAFTL